MCSPPPIATLWFPDANAFAPAANARGADAHTDAPKAVDPTFVANAPPPSATGGAPSDE